MEHPKAVGKDLLTVYETAHYKPVSGGASGSARNGGRQNQMGEWGTAEWGRDAVDTGGGAPFEGNLC